ncbi:MAG: hypothetical protein V2I33_17920 [Kangiellaceae bacterium]|nr:hypothetical protein [Kangiellaceae bacterium]
MNKSPTTPSKFSTTIFDRLCVFLRLKLNLLVVPNFSGVNGFIDFGSSLSTNDKLEPVDANDVAECVDTSDFDTTGYHFVETVLVTTFLGTSSVVCIAESWSILKVSVFARYGR